jgi:hypothetical protein
VWAFFELVSEGVEVLVAVAAVDAGVMVVVDANGVAAWVYSSELLVTDIFGCWRVLVFVD